MQLYTGDKIANYQIVEYLASGGYGSVYKAQDMTNDQIVALKMMDPGTSREYRNARFVREIEILSRLQHPNIVRVYHWETSQEPLWYTMELLTGPSLQKLITEELPLYQKVSILRQIASAIGCMHDQGYIHRDVKPQNIMFRTPDRSTPVLFDMGLVHDPCSNLTLGYQILGTPGYLSPEQLDGRSEHKQIDVWALGVILYQWLTKTHPFAGAGKSTIEVMHSIRNTEIVHPKTLPRVDAYLGEVCYHALSRDLEHRYPDGRSFENALAKWENVNYTRCLEEAHESAKRERIEQAVTYMEQAYMWQPDEGAVRELKKLWERKLGCSELRLIPHNKLDEARKRAQEKGEKLGIIEERTVKNFEISPYEHSYWVCVKHNRKLAPEILAKIGENEKRLREHPPVVNPRPPQPVTAGTVSPQGISTATNEMLLPVLTQPKQLIKRGRLVLLLILILTISGAAVVVYTNREYWTLLTLYYGTTQEYLAKKYLQIKHVLFSEPSKPDHSQITKQPDIPPKTGPESDIATTFQLQQVLQRHSGAVHTVCFSEDRKHLLSGSSDKTLRLWELETGKELKTLSGHSSMVWPVCWQHHDKIIASGGNDSKIKIWNSETAKEIVTLPAHAPIVLGLSFSPDGKWLASCGGDKQIKIWDMSSFKEIFTLRGHSKWVMSVAFAPDGKLLASGSTDKTIKLWDSRTGKELATLSGQTQEVYSLTFSPDGKWLVSGSEDGSVRLWNATTGQPNKILGTHPKAVLAVTVSPDSKLVASGGVDRTVRVWEIASGKEIFTVPGFSDWILALAFSQDGKLLASGGKDSAVKVYSKAGQK